VSEGLRKKIIDAVHAFPAFSLEASQVLNLLYDAESNASEIERVVKHDPGLTANLLRIANSAYFGFPGRIASVGQAVTQMGWKRVYQIIIASTLNAMMDTNVPGYELSRGELWRHSVAVAVAAETLARRRHIEGAEEIFTAGLLHDVGKLILGGFIKADLSRVEVATANNTSFVKIERELFGTDHAEIGAWILDHWSLPGHLTTAVRRHHEPDAAGERTDMLDIVHMADMLCLMMGLGLGREGLQYNLSSCAAERTEIRNVQLEAVGCQTLEDTEEFIRAARSS